MSIWCEGRREDYYRMHAVWWHPWISFSSCAFASGPCCNLRLPSYTAIVVTT